ncbi:MAG: hypothetical protein U1E51_17605 [Candidatus Binatia bacterium]|nr:hypothetical protein [Candidatus Binatia bacterium]
MKPTLTMSPEEKNRDSSKDPLAHVPTWDRTKAPPDDVLEEEGLLRALKKANEALAKKPQLN